MRILILVGGTNEPSNADMAASEFMAGMQEAGITVVKIRVKDIHMEQFQIEHYSGRDQGPDLARIKEEAMAAHGIVIASPIWNFSVPAHLKNVIDHMGVFGLDSETRTKGQLTGKVCYTIFTGGAPLAAWKGLMRFTTMHVREAMRYFGCSPVGTLFIPKCTAGRGKFCLVVDTRKNELEKLHRKGKEFGNLVISVSKTGMLPWKLRMIQNLYGLGQRIMAKL